MEKNATILIDMVSGSTTGLFTKLNLRIYKGDEMKTLKMEVPDIIKVTGARGITRDIDLSTIDANTLAGIVDYWFGVVTVRASAGVDSFEDKVKAENKKADQLASMDWKPGAGGGGGKLDITAQANRRVLAMLFESEGYKATNAVKAAAKKTAWFNFFMVALSKKENRPATHEEIDLELEAQKDAIQEMIDKAVEQIKAEAASKKTLASGLSFG